MRRIRDGDGECPWWYGDGVRASASSIVYSCATRRSKGEAGDRDSETDRGGGKRKRRGAVGGVHSGTTHTPMNSYREAKRPKGRRLCQRSTSIWRPAR